MRRRTTTRQLYDAITNNLLQIQKAQIHNKNIRKTEEIECEVEDEYPFLQNEITRENAGKVLAKTLLKIVSASPEESLAAKKEFLWHLVRLFEVFRVYTI